MIKGELGGDYTNSVTTVPCGMDIIPYMLLCLPAEKYTTIQSNNLFAVKKYISVSQLFVTEVN